MPTTAPHHSTMEMGRSRTDATRISVNNHPVQPATSMLMPLTGLPMPPNDLIALWMHFWHWQQERILGLERAYPSVFAYDPQNPRPPYEFPPDDPYAQYRTNQVGRRRRPNLYEERDINPNQNNQENHPPSPNQDNGDCGANKDYQE